MSKKIFVLLLSFFVMMFACSVASAEDYYALVDSDDNDMLESHLVPDYTYIGYNYKATYSLPSLILYYYTNSEDKEYGENGTNLNGTVEYDIVWTLSPDIPDLKVYEGTDASGDAIIISGIVPTKSYDISVVATVTNITDSTYSGAEGEIKVYEVETIDAEKESYHNGTVVTPSSDDFTSYVSPASGVTVTEVKSNYSVTIKAEYNTIAKKYLSYIQSQDVDGPNYVIDIPEWLTVSNVTYATAEELDKSNELTSGDFSNTYPLTSVTISINKDVTVADGTKGTVHIPFYDADQDKDGIVLYWPVTYSASKEDSRPFGVSGDKEVSFNFPINRTTSKRTKTITYNAGLLGESIASCDISGTGASLISADWTAISGDTGTITITVTIPEATSSVSTAAVTSATYDGDLVFWGSQGSSFDVSVTITVNTNTLSITADTTSFSLEAGASKDITLNADATVLSWEVGSTSSDITAEITASDDTSATVRVTAGESATAGTRTITITATGENNISSSVTLTVTLTESVFTITADTTALELEAGDYDTVTVTAENGTVVSWDVEADDGITCEITASDDAAADIEITVDDDTEDGEYIATVTAEDEDGNTAEVSITVTVTSASGDATYSVTLTASSTAVTLPTGGSRDITLTAGGTHSGDLTWTHSAAPTGLVVNVLNTSNTSATARIGVYTTATAGTKSPITVTATDKAGNSASVSITVTVTSNTSTDVQQDYINNHSSATPVAVSESVFNAISNTVSTFFRSLGINVSVASLPISAFSSTTKTVADSAIVAEYAGTGETPILAFPEILASAITESKVYMFAVDYAQLKAAVDAGLLNYSDPIFIHMRPQTSSTGSINASATADADSALFDNNGNEIIKMPNSDNGINIAAYLEANTAYSPVITAATATTSGDSTLGPANVGCNGGFGSLFGFLGMAFTASALYLRKRKD
ncbi:MAG: hypothetical protein IJT20_05845 [Synergistaceae bacterium]|nr:hypothetical protein [Synergistaceae bacterium]